MLKAGAGDAISAVSKMLQADITKAMPGKIMNINLLIRESVDMIGIFMAKVLGW
jgi:hypothetical protein